MKIIVTVHPNSRKPRVETDSLGGLHVYVNQPPLEGRANEAVIVALAERFGVPKSNVRLERGGKSRHKTFSIHER